MTSSILDQFIKRSRQLYSLPAVARQVVDLTNQSTVDIAAFQQCIEADPALTKKILRVVNSSLFGLTRQVTDLNQALGLLGTKPLTLLVLGFSLPKELLTGVEADVLQRYWRRNAIKAVAARELAETLWRVPGDDAFIAALLQDLGVLVLIQDLGDSYLAFLERIYRDGGDLLTLETATLGFNHAVLTSRLLESWELPESIVRDVGQPFDADTLAGLSEHERVVPQILHMADLMAEFLTHERASMLNELLVVGGRYHGVSIVEIESLIGSLETKVPQLAEVLSPSPPSEIAYSTLLSRAYEQGAGAATMLHQTSAPTLVFDVEAAVKSCRQSRQAVSLALLELDHADRLATQLGMAQFQRTLDRLHFVLKRIVDEDGRVVQVDDHRFAVILERIDRQPAVALTRQLVRCAREWSAEQATTDGHAISLSAGVAALAMPSKNFPCQELIDAAERCLHGVQLSGGDSVKSIDIL
ncbi:MAG: HDOD domain-containing protein [Pirellulaceae bacterium]